MDRLYALNIAVLAVASLAGCGDDASSAVPPSRVVAVAADPDDAPNVAEFCDVMGSGPDAIELTLPELAGDAPAAASGVRWVNVWATWCAPCVEEIPRLLSFRERLAESDTNVDLVFLSADRDDDVVTEFRQAHPDTPEGPRIADPTTLPQWAVSMGLDEGATLPVHVFADRQGRVRCARTGGVDDAHFDVIEAIVSR